MNKISSFEAFKLSPYYSSKHSNYFLVYDNLLNKFQESKVTFLEIGILDGGSLFMWRKYFGSRARIIGVDINPEALKWKEFGFEIFIGDQSDPLFWDDLIGKVGGVDVVLDDGGHTYLQQIVTTRKLVPIINDGGLIIIEDCHTSYESGFGSRKFSFINYVFELVDQVNLRHFKCVDKNLVKNIHSISFFQSIVVLHVNSTVSGNKANQISNDGISFGAIDMRHSKNTYIKLFDSLQSNLKFFKFIPGIKKLSTIVWNFIGNFSSPKKRLRNEFNTIINS
jgi:hypothetical protein